MSSPNPKVDVQERHKISVRTLPSENPTIFKESTFFTRNGPGTSLPSPIEVRSLQRTSNYRPIVFPSLGLLVKYGPNITIAEGQCLWVLRRLIPVPEVYGWCEDNGEVFIYQELIEGVTLEKRWPELSLEDRVSVCEQLKGMVGALRSLRQDPEDRFLGHINRTPLLDIVFTDTTKPPAGPFTRVKAFHDWLSWMTKRGMEIHWPDPSLIPDPYRDLMPDNSLITFTHADLHPSNIMVSVESPCKVIAIIDWHQSGWYPDYWEYCKVLFTVEVGGEWAVEYIPRFLEVAECLDSWCYYPQTLGY